MSCAAQLVPGREDRPCTEMTVEPAAPCEFLLWDTEFFGFRVARVNGDTLNDNRASEVDNWCRADAIRCLYLLARSDCPATIRNAERHGFGLVDLRLTLERKAGQASRLPLSKGQISAAGKNPTTTSAGPNRAGGSRDACAALLSIRPAVPEDVPTLQAIAKAGHHDARFFSDPHFPRPLAEALYSTWIRLECEGRAQCVFVAAAAENPPVGYISCHLDAEQRAGQIGLIAVSQAAQGQGCGRALVTTALNWFAEQGAERVSVVTQGRNIAAQRLYQGCGFLSASMQLWFHKWFPTHD